MRKADLKRLERIAQEIEQLLANPLKQSHEFFRGDLRALMNAAKEVQAHDWYNQQFAKMVAAQSAISRKLSVPKSPPLQTREG